LHTGVNVSVILVISCEVHPLYLLLAQKNKYF
jgi:hypothetical protein